MQLVVIGSAAGRRVALLQQALAGLGLPPALVVGYADLLEGRVALPDVVPPGAAVRIESHDRDPVAEQALLLAGLDSADAPGFERLSRAEALALLGDRGRLRGMRQWYLGLCVLLDQIRRQLAACPPHRLMADPDDIAVMFDKRACHARLAARGVAVPQALGPVLGYDELLAAMAVAGWQRVFVKPAHGSSAAGVVAYEISGVRHQATTTVELVEQGGAVQLYTTRRLRVYRDQGQIATLIDALGRQRVHVERWLPKAGVADRTFDLRVVVIAGRARHVVVRMSRSPLTNLHLLNQRAGPEIVRGRMRPEDWAAVCRTCEDTLACFPSSLYAGVDLLIAPGYRRHAVLEVNAFGDLLPGALDEGVDTYTAELMALLCSTHAR